MLNIHKSAVVLSIALIAIITGCRQKQPAVTPKGEANSSEGPLLAPPKQETRRRHQKMIMPHSRQKASQPVSQPAMKWLRRRMRPRLRRT